MSQLLQNLWGGGGGGGVELSPPIKISGGAKAPQPPILYAYM